MSIASPYPDVTIPKVSVYDYLFGDIAESELDRPALVDTKPETATTSYRELIGRIDAFAGALANAGVGVGDVVGLLAPNSSAFAIAFHGILRAGATATTINALFTAKDIARQLTDAKASMLITISALADGAKAAIDELGIDAAHLVILDGPGLEASGHPNAVDLLGPNHPAPDVRFDPHTHIAVLPYSSGTTAAPKGVKLTHYNLVANVCQIRPMQGMVPDDAILAVLPFFHIYGMTVLLNAALHSRARLIIMPRFDLTEFLDNVATHKVTYGFIAPPVAVALAKHPLVDNYDLSSVHTIMSGAAPLDAELGHAVEKRLGCRMIQGYGMSELSPVSHCIPADGGVAIRGENAPLSSSGWTVANAVSKIVDPATGGEIGVPSAGLSEPGELWFAGPNVMAGYLNNDEATQSTIDADGFLHTGDIAQVDQAGCIYIVDRLKELIKYKGYQVPPAELEALLLTHPKIADAAVIGATDADSGEEIPKAYVVLQDGVELTGDEVMAFVAENVAPYKKVRQVQFIDAIPKSASGKILRKDLRTPAH